MDMRIAAVFAAREHFYKHYVVLLSALVRRRRAQMRLDASETFSLSFPARAWLSCCCDRGVSSHNHMVLLWLCRKSRDLEFDPSMNQL